MRTFLLCLVASILTACSTSSGNPTTYAYKIEDTIRDNTDSKRLIIAHVNFGKPSRLYLQDYEQRVDDFLKAYLKKHGYNFVSSALFEQAWQESVRKHGNPFDESTGKLNQKTFQLVVADTVNQLKERNDVDYVMFTDLIEREVQFTTGISHVARWDGVTRKPSLQGPGDGIPGGFNWAASVDAVSLWVNVFSLDLALQFQSAGGIEVTQAIDMKASNPKFIRRRTILGNKSNIEEGIKLAMHPLVAMKGYPGEKK
ncbi:MAG: hypothetical protein ACR2P1_14495 [Pseudomonadales bacterium]